MSLKRLSPKEINNNTFVTDLLVLILNILEVSNKETRKLYKNPHEGLLTLFLLYNKHETIIRTGITCKKISLYKSIEFGMSLK